VTRLEKIQQIERANLRCAEIILNDAEKYGGPTSLLVQWAWAVVRKHQQERAA
jgi:hypothetical protein